VSKAAAGVMRRNLWSCFPHERVMPREKEQGLHTLEVKTVPQVSARCALCPIHSYEFRSAQFDYPIFPCRIVRCEDQPASS